MKKKNGFTPFETMLSFLLNKNGKISKRAVDKTGAGHGRSPEGDLSLTGFTLIEIMLVVIILGVLAAMVVPRLVGRSEEARKSVAKTDIESGLALSLDLYETDSGAYPESLGDLLKSPSNSENWKGPYLKKKPVDPWGHAYVYKYPGTHNTDGYDLLSMGKDGVEGTADDVTNWQED